MKIYVAKHYWRDKETATWQVSSRFDREIFQYIKNNYSQIIHKKVHCLKMNAKYIYIYYKKKKDIYSRDITEIVAYQCKRKIDIGLDKRDNNSLEFRIFDRDEGYIIAFILILIISSYLIYRAIV